MTAGASVKKGNRTSLGFIIDTTKSMSEDHKHIVDWSTKLLTNNWEETNIAFSQFIVSPFNDPTHGPVTVVSKATSLIKVMKKQTSHGGGDCKELSLHGILGAANLAKPNALFVVFTDALPKDLKILPLVQNIVYKKRIRIIFAITGCCGLRPCKKAGLEPYRILAKITNGALYEVGKNGVYYILKMVTMFSEMRNFVIPRSFLGVINFIKSDGHPELLKSHSISKQTRKKIKKTMSRTCFSKKMNSMAAKFVHGCTKFTCELGKVKVFKTQCDATRDGTDCREVHESWGCSINGNLRTCVCDRDEDGAIIKIV